MLLATKSASESVQRVKVGPRGFERCAAMATEVESRSDGEGNCQICAAAGDLWVRLAGGSGQYGGFSHESEHDLAVMVSDFLENGSSGADSRCSSDSDSGYSDLAHLVEKISFHKHTVDQYEIDLLSTVRSLILSIGESELHFVNSGPCNASCIRQSLVKHLRFSGYDAAVCSSKWQGFGKVPGGDHEYIDLVSTGTGSPERMIIDIDFQSHFEIARAVESYDALLYSLPVVYVGSPSKLKQYLQVMVEAARSSLKQNSMPLPPWRSLAYLQAKWHSTFERKLNPDTSSHSRAVAAQSNHKQCIGQLRRLKSALQSEIEKERLLKPIINDNNNNRRVKFDVWRQQPVFRA